MTKAEAENAAPETEAPVEVEAPVTAEAATEEAPAKEKKPPKPPKEKLPPLDQQNGVTRPRDRSDSKTSQVWNIADEISRKEQRPATRAEVVEEGQKAGINPATISTQFAKWRKFNGIVGRQPAPEKPEVEEEAATAAE